MSLCVRKHKKKKKKTGIEDRYTVRMKITMIKVFPNLKKKIINHRFIKLIFPLCTQIPSLLCHFNNKNRFNIFFEIYILYCFINLFISQNCIIADIDRNFNRRLSIFIIIKT